MVIGQRPTSSSTTTLPILTVSEIRSVPVTTHRDVFLLATEEDWDTRRSTTLERDFDDRGRVRNEEIINLRLAGGNYLVSGYSRSLDGPASV